MKVSKTSWHYKLVSEWASNFYKINDGCSYLRSLIEVIAVMLFMLVVCIVVFLVPGSLIAKAYDLTGYWAGSTIIGGSAIIWAVIVGIGYGLYKLKNNKSEVTIVKELIAAKKEKYCPSLEYID